MISANTNSADCGAVTCEARESSCSTAATNVQIVAGFLLQMKQDVVVGYNEIVCIRCVNTPQNTQTADVMTKTVTFTQKRDCLTALTLASVTNYVTPYEATGTTTYSITDGETAFTNAHGFADSYDKCPLISCTVTSSDCTAATSGNEAKTTVATSTSPYALTTIGDV